MVKLIKVTDELHKALSLIKLKNNYNSLNEVLEKKFRAELDSQFLKKFNKK